MRAGRIGNGGGQQRFADPAGVGVALVLAALRDVPEGRRTARFVCALVLLEPGRPLLACTGTMEGRIGTTERGDGGFGYDSLFLVDDGRTLAELAEDAKNAISHRGRAVAELLAFLRARLTSAS